MLCGGDLRKNPQAKLYRHDLYCFVYENKAMRQSCKSKGLNITLNATGAAKMQCAGFEFPPDNVGEQQTRTLQYGETIRGKGCECRSETSGLSCKNSAGHGFQLNRLQNKLF